MRNNRENTKVGGGGGRGSSGTTAGIPQQPDERTTPEQMDLLEGTAAHGQPTLEQVFS